MTKPSWDKYFLGVAEAVAQRASCPRFKVGAVLVSFNRIIATGYNGASAGQPECMKVGCEMIDGHCKRAIHAEENAINYLAESETYANVKVYTKLEPCDDCYAYLRKYLGPNPQFIWKISQKDYKKSKV